MLIKPTTLQMPIAVVTNDPTDIINMNNMKYVYNTSGSIFLTFL